MRKAVALFTVLLILSACLKDTMLTSKIAAEIVQTKNLRLTAHDQFALDSLIILQPDTSIEQVELKSGLNLKYVSHNIESLDNINLMVFLKNNSAIKTVELNRSFGDFNGIYNQIIPKSRANFILTGDLFPKNPAILHLKN